MAQVFMLKIIYFELSRCSKFIDAVLIIIIIVFLMFSLFQLLVTFLEVTFCFALAPVNKQNTIRVRIKSVCYKNIFCSTKNKSEQAHK
jgi:hypothetical protein